MNLRPDRRGVDAEFIARQRQIAAQKPADHPRARVVLAEAGPDRHHIRANRRQGRRKLVPEALLVQADRRPGGGAGVQEGAGINVPTVGPETGQVLLRPGNNEPAVGSSQDARVGAHIGEGIDGKLAAGGRAVRVENPGVKVNAVVKALLLRNPRHHKPPIAQRRDGRRALVRAGKLIDKHRAAHLLAGRREHLRVNILEAVAAELVVTAPGYHHVAINQRRGGRGDLEVVGEGIDQHVAGGRHPRAAGRQEPGVDVLIAPPPPLPDKRRPAAAQPADLGVFLVARANRINAERRIDSGQTAVELQGADPQAVAVREVILPDEVAAGIPDAKAGMDLVSGQSPGDGVLHTIGLV